MTTNRKQLHERLWAATEQLRAGGALKLNQMCEPILGLIFLKFADVKFCWAKKVATLEEIRANDYSLNPRRYVEIVEKEMSNVNFDARMKELMGEFNTLTSEAHKLEKKIQEDWKKVL